MKFTSIVFAALVAATQFSSTFAGGEVVTAPDAVTTSDSRAVTFNVLDNDKEGTVNGGKIVKSVDIVGTPSAGISLAGAVAPLTLIVGPNVEVPGTVSVTANGGCLFTPTAPGVGVTKFSYIADVSTTGSPSASQIVTITIGAAPGLADFLFAPISNAAAVNTVRGKFTDVASFTPGFTDATVTAVTTPVLDVNNFIDNTSFGVVNKSFGQQFLDFFQIFRGGN
jgi:hypothetical protein